MAFRDENEALRQRVQKLEDELADTRQELEELRNPPKVRVEIEEGRAEEAPVATSGLAAKVAAKERAQRAAEERREHEARERRRKERERLAKHGSRLKVGRVGSETIIDVGPGPLREQLLEQAGFGIFFAAINPGIFIVIGLAAWLAFSFDELPFGSAIGIAVPIWLTILMVLNLVYAYFARSRFRITFDDENFEVKKTGSGATSFLGRRKDLEVRVDETAPGEVRLRHSIRERGTSSSIEIEGLIQKDLDAFRQLMVRPQSEPEDAMAVFQRMQSELEL